MILNNFHMKETALKICASTILLSIFAKTLFFNVILVSGSDLIILLSLVINTLFFNNFLRFKGAFYG